MSNLISGKEALIALANGEDVECTITGKNEWTKDIYGIQPYYFLGGGTGQFQFRLKPRTITINGIEVPAPFEPKDDCIVYILDDSKTINYRPYHYCLETDDSFDWIGVWKTEEEIKQVVSALRTVFGGKS